MNKFETILLTDVDGTLDFRCSGIDKKTYQAANEYVKSGGGLGIATGRAIVSTVEIARRLHVNVPCILYGGAMLYDFELSLPVWMCPADQAVLLIAEKIMREIPAVSLMIYTDTGISILKGNDMLFEKGIPEESSPEFINCPVNGNIMKLNLCGERDELEHIERTYFSDKKYNFTYASMHFAEIVSPEAGKGRAMEALSQILHLPLEHFIAMGDGHNDLDMLRRAGTAYTLENASDEIKEAADVVLPHCSKGGAASGFSLALKKTGAPG